MQTSLARRERRRRNGTGTHRQGGGSGGRVAAVLPIFLLATFFVLSLVTFVGAVEVYSAYGKDLDDPKALLESLDFSQQTVLYDRTGTVQLAAFGSEHRRVLKFEEIPNIVLDSTTSTEDKTFWSNTGFDPAAVLSALRDAVSGRARGASTITQQLVRQRLLPPTTSTVDRKIKEIIQSVRLTQEFPGEEGKQAIITAYLNLNFYGNQSYGIAAAAEGYFGVTDLSKLTPAQAAILAAILQAPSAYDLVANADQMEDGTLVVPNDAPIVIRRNSVLEDMRRNNRDGLLKGKYDDAALLVAESDPVILHPAPHSENIAPHFDLLVRQQLADLICGQGTDPADCEAVDTGGYKVITTLDASMQASAEKWLKAYVLGPNQPTLDADIAYLANLGITAKSDPYNYSRIIGPSSTSKTGLRTGNIHNGALIAVDYRTGQVLTYAGSAGFYEKTVKDPAKPGFDYFDPEYDVLSSGVGRQPGSAFKPIIYLTALEQGYTPDTILRDSPLSFTNPYTGVVWSPKNYRNEYHGDVPMRRALELSLNTATVRLLEKVGVENVIDMAKQLHINSKFEPNLSLSLGTTEIAPLDLAAAYVAFARGGTYIPPTAIKTIATIDGEEKYNEEPPEEPVVVPEVAYALVDILKGVIQRGTARAAAKMPYYLAGKTGTTDDFRDAWFIGFSPNLLCAVWVGYDKKVNLAGKEAGATAALPIWIDFMSKALQHYPNEDFSPPKGESYVP